MHYVFIIYTIFYIYIPVSIVTNYIYYTYIHIYKLPHNKHTMYIVTIYINIYILHTIYIFL